MSPMAKTICDSLERRRRELGMPYRVLAKRSGLGAVTVQRALKGDARARLDTITALANALGAEVTTTATDPRELRQREAEAKAKRLVAMAQGSAALEGQAVQQSTLSDMEQGLVDKLLGGSNRRIWA